jgi:lysophospholipase L1-like esterase
MRIRETRVFRIAAFLAALATFAAECALRSAEPPPDRFARWEKEIRAFEENDRQKPPSHGGIVFVGSSSIRFWKLDKSFPGMDYINRGFGGSQLADSVHFLPRIVLPYEPRTVVLYAGDNDLAAGKTPEQVAADFKEFVQAIHSKLPKTRIVFVCIKPSLARWKLIDKIRNTNELIADFCKSDNRLVYVDVATPMLGPDGKPQRELFLGDGLHLNDTGYGLWAKLLKPHLQ